MGVSSSPVLNDQKHQPSGSIDPLSEHPAKEPATPHRCVCGGRNPRFRHEDFGGRRGSPRTTTGRGSGHPRVGASRARSRGPSLRATPRAPPRPLAGPGVCPPTGPAGPTPGARRVGGCDPWGRNPRFDTRILAVAEGHLGPPPVGVRTTPAWGDPGAPEIHASADPGGQARHDSAGLAALVGHPRTTAQNAATGCASSRTPLLCIYFPGPSRGAATFRLVLGTKSF